MQWTVESYSCRQSTNWLNAHRTQSCDRRAARSPLWWWPCSTSYALCQLAFRLPPSKPCYSLFRLLVCVLGDPCLLGHVHSNRAETLQWNASYSSRSHHPGHGIRIGKDAQMYRSDWSLAQLFDWFATEYIKGNSYSRWTVLQVLVDSASFCHKPLHLHQFLTLGDLFLKPYLFCFFFLFFYSVSHL